MKNDKRFLWEFIRKHKVISAIIIFCVFVALLISLTFFCSWMEANGQLSAVGSVIVEVVSIALGLILAFSYDSWMKRMDLDEDKKNILLGIKQELSTIINKINNDDTLSEILSQKTYYSSILSSDSVQKILDTAHFQMISGLYNIVRRFEINSFDFIDDASIIERQNLLAQIFPKNNKLFEIANLRNLSEKLPIDILNLKRHEYLKRLFINTSIDYEILSNLIFDSEKSLKCHLFRIVDSKYRKKLLNKNIYIYNVALDNAVYIFILKNNKESLFFSWVTVSERRNFYRNILANG